MNDKTQIDQTENNKIIRIKLVVRVSAIEIVMSRFKLCNTYQEQSKWHDMIMNTMLGRLRPYNEEPSSACRGETDFEDAENED